MLLFTSSISVLLFIIRAFNQQSIDYWYLNWNLFLAWLPLIFAWQLVIGLKKWPWSGWQNVVLSLLWLGFLPNSFYIITDFIHLQHTLNATLLFDVVLLLSFTLNGLILGYMSVYLVHLQLSKRFQKSYVQAMIATVFLLCSFAIYLGRYLRWNTWDVLINPAGILFDVSDRFINPGAHGQTFTTTALFFVFISTFYITICQFMNALKYSQSRKK